MTAQSRALGEIPRGASDLSVLFFLPCSYCQPPVPRSAPRARPLWAALAARWAALAAGKFGPSAGDVPSRTSPSWRAGPGEPEAGAAAGRLPGRPVSPCAGLCAPPRAGPGASGRPLWLRRAGTRPIGCTCPRAVLLWGQMFPAVPPAGRGTPRGQSCCPPGPPAAGGAQGGPRTRGARGDARAVPAFPERATAQPSSLWSPGSEPGAGTAERAFTCRRCVRNHGFGPGSWAGWTQLRRARSGKEAARGGEVPTVLFQLGSCFCVLGLRFSAFPRPWSVRAAALPRKQLTNRGRSDWAEFFD